MFWWIVCITFVCFFLLGVLIVLQSLEFSITSSLHQGSFSFQFAGVWAHPAILKFHYNTHDGLQTVVLGRTLGKANENELSKEKPEDSKNSPFPQEDIAEQVSNTHDFKPWYSQQEQRSTNAGDSGSDISEPDSSSYEDKSKMGSNEQYQGDSNETTSAVPSQKPLETNTEHKATSSTTHKGLIKRWQESDVAFFLDLRFMVRKSLRYMTTVFRAFLCVIQFKRCNVFVKAGTTDPSVVGQVYGHFIALRNGLLFHQQSNVTFEMEPVFNQGFVLEWDAGLCLRTSLARILYPIVIIVVAFPYVSSFLIWRRFRKRRLMKRKQTV